MSSTKKATAEIMAIFEGMYNKDDENEDTAEGDDDDVKAAPSKKQKVAVRELLTTDVLAVRELSELLTTDVLAVRELSELLTTDDAVELALAASQYYVNQNTDGDYDGLACAKSFGTAVYHKARDELKPQYKEAFDVKAIAKAFAKSADASWN